MATKYFLDSNDRITSSDSPCNYLIQYSQSQYWPTVPKDVGDGLTTWNLQTVNIESLYLNSNVLSSLSYPLLKLNFYDTALFDNTIINTLNNQDADFRFVLNRDITDVGLIGWRRYSTSLEWSRPVMSIGPNSFYRVTIMDINGTILPDILQTLLYITFLPYERDSRFKLP